MPDHDCDRDCVGDPHLECGGWLINAARGKYPSAQVAGEYGGACAVCRHHLHVSHIVRVTLCTRWRVPAPPPRVARPVVQVDEDRGRVTIGAAAGGVGVICQAEGARQMDGSRSVVGDGGLTMSCTSCVATVPRWARCTASVTAWAVTVARAAAVPVASAVDPGPLALPPCQPS
jgi:hypothetical protein